RLPARSNRSSKKDGPNPTVTVSPAATEVERLAGVDRGRLRCGFRRSDRLACGHSRRCGGPGAEHGLHGLDVRGRDVECRERQPVLCRRRDSPLVLAVERHLAGGRRRPTRFGGPRYTEPGTARGSNAGRTERDTEEATSARPGRRRCFGHTLTTLLATRD